MPDPAWKQFDGGAFTDATKSVGPKAKLRGQVSLQAAKKPSAGPMYHPTAEYKVLKPSIEGKLPKDKVMENQPLGAPDYKAISKSGDDQNYFRKWGDASAMAQKLSEANVKQVGAVVTKEADDTYKVSRPEEGKRMIVRAPINSLKSKWAGVTPRPSTANPVPQPTNATLTKKFKVTLEQSVEGEGMPFDTIAATFPEPGKAGPIKWRMELKCTGWQRPIGIMAETPRASFKLADAQGKALAGKLFVRGATVDSSGKCSQWTEWHKVEEPQAEAARKKAAEEAAAAVAERAAAEALQEKEAHEQLVADKAAADEKLAEAESRAAQEKELAMAQKVAAEAAEAARVEAVKAAESAEAKAAEAARLATERAQQEAQEQMAERARDVEAEAAARAEIEKSERARFDAMLDEARAALRAEWEETLRVHRREELHKRVVISLKAGMRHETMTKMLAQEQERAELAEQAAKGAETRALLVEELLQQQQSQAPAAAPLFAFLPDDGSAVMDEPESGMSSDPTQQALASSSEQSLLERAQRALEEVAEGAEGAVNAS